MVGQSSLLGKFLAIERPCLQKQDGLLLWNSIWSFPLTSMNMHSCMSLTFSRKPLHFINIILYWTTVGYPTFSGYESTNPSLLTTQHKHSLSTKKEMGMPRDKITAALPGRLHGKDKKMLFSVMHTSQKAVFPVAPILLDITLIVLTELLDERRRSENQVTSRHESHHLTTRGSVREQFSPCWPCLPLCLQHWMSARQAWSVNCCLMEWMGAYKPHALP